MSEFNVAFFRSIWNIMIVDIWSVNERNETSETNDEKKKKHNTTGTAS